MIVFINARKLDVQAGAVRDALRVFDPALAAQAESGAQVVLDDRGLPVDLDAPLHGGRILRLVPSRAADPQDALLD